MSVNFYHLLGQFVAGVDVHDYVQVSTTKVKTPHIVEPFFFPWLGTYHKMCPRVLIDGIPALQSGYDWYLLKHLPIPAGPPHPVLEPVELIKIYASSGSVAKMNVHSVTGQGTELATCVGGFVGVQPDCGIGAGFTVCVSTVKTTPSLGDYVGMIAGWAADILVGLAVDQLPNSGVFGILPHILRRAPDVLNNPFLDVPGYAQKFSQRAVDEGLTEATRQLARDLESSTETTFKNPISNFM
jgi:hypothetical protein